MSAVSLEGLLEWLTNAYIKVSSQSSSSTSSTTSIRTSDKTGFYIEFAGIRFSERSLSKSFSASTVSFLGNFVGLR